MDIRFTKRLLIAAFVAGSISLCLPSCSSCSSAGTEEESTYVNKEYVDSLNKTIKSYTELTQEQRETLFRIMKELDEIADSAFALGKERQLKGKVKNKRMVDKVKFRLATVKTELDQAREKAMENPELRATIDNLTRQIAEQEDYINHLRSSIQVKKGKLQKRLEELENIKDQLETTKIVLENTNTDLVNEQQKLDDVTRKSWISVGNKLEESADQINLVKKSGPTVKKTKDAKRRILQRAKECYNKAAELGDPTARQKADQVEMKIQNLN